MIQEVVALADLADYLIQHHLRPVHLELTDGLPLLVCVFKNSPFDSDNDTTRNQPILQSESPGPACRRDSHRQHVCQTMLW